ncbi:hypothetical protein ICW40_10410, partial [Actinotalea ferrariae]|uniref:hypothetical protein n=1 Tax=Actinotalea ferrariae TaxID=1386098 RepID=UPI001C8BB82E
RAALHALAAPGPRTGTDGDPAEPWAEAVAAWHTARIRAVLGGDFPVVPVVELPTALAAELTASTTDGALLDGARLAPAEWLLAHSRVRPAAGRLWSVLCEAERRRTGVGATQLAVAQLPYRPGEPWVGLRFADGAPARPAGTSLVLLRSDGASDPVPTRVAALVVDQWHEHLSPRTETTGVAFHFDAPGARAPQSVLLAVPPDQQAATWSTEALVDTVLEAVDLTRARTVDLDDVLAIGRFMPALYLAFDLERAVPSLDISAVVRTAVLQATLVPSSDPEVVDP